MSVIKTSITQLKNFVKLSDLHKQKPADERMIVKVKEMFAEGSASPDSDSELIIDNRLRADLLRTAASLVRQPDPPLELLSMRASSFAPRPHPRAPAPPFIEKLLKDLGSSNNINPQPVIVAPVPQGVGVITTKSDGIGQCFATFRELISEAEKTPIEEFYRASCASGQEQHGDCTPARSLLSPVRVLYGLICYESIIC